MQNRGAIFNQKSIKNRSWGVLGRLGTEKGKRKGTPRVPVRHLGASWRLLGPSWSEKGSQHGSNLAPKTEPKSIENRSQNRSIFECLPRSDFWRILMDLGRKMEPSWHPDGIKNRWQLRKAIFWKNVVLPWEKHWFWRFWRSKLRPKIDQKSIQKWRQVGKASWHRFFMDFLRFWRPRWSQVGRENR